MTDLDWLPSADTTPLPEMRRRHRHDWHSETVVTYSKDGLPYRATPLFRCSRCNAIRDETRARRGKNNRARGNAIEREVAAKLGLRRVGQYGGPHDAAGEWLVVQVKSGRSFPERAWRWLQALPRNAAQTRAVVLTDAPGPGHRRRAVVLVDLDDWAALHGEMR